MKQTFEDRLLDELKREVVLGAQRRPECTRPGRQAAVLRRTAWGLAACGAVAMGATLLPGPADTPAYAVEPKPDGSVSVKFNDISLDRDEQRNLARELRGLGVHVSIDTPPAGMRCKEPRGDYGHQDLRKGEFVLGAGDTLIITNLRYPKSQAHDTDLSFGYVRGKAGPCVPVPNEPPTGLRAPEKPGPAPVSADAE